MLGAIIGDVIGSTYEFNNTKDYNFKLFPEGSKYTDDTVLSCAVADLLLRCYPYHDELLVNHFANAFLEFGKKFPNPMGGYGSGFVRWLYGENHEPYNSCGNGAAMRVIPIGWAFPADGKPINIKKTCFLAFRSAYCTHNHPEGIKGAQATAMAIYYARCGKSKNEIRYEIELLTGYDLSKSWEEIRKDYKWDGTCQGSVPQAISCFLDSTDFEDAIRKAVSIGGDSDTIGCITGGIAEAFYRDIPSFMKIKAINTLPSILKDILERFQKTFIG